MSGIKVKIQVDEEETCEWK